MLAKEPEERISTKEALAHPAFEAVLSKSPLIVKDDHNPEDLLRMKEYAEKLDNKREEAKEEQGKRYAEQNRRLESNST